MLFVKCNRNAPFEGCYALPNGFRLRMLPRSVPAVFRQTGEIFYIGGTDVLPAPLEGQEEADAIAGLSDPENETARSELIPSRSNG